MDINQLQLDDCQYNEGTICLVDKLMGAWGMVFRAWAHERSPLNSQWLVLRIGGADFLHCWVANSIWLERTESLKLSDSFNGGLFRALTKFTAVLPVNNSLVRHVGLLLLGPVTHYRES